MFEKSNTVFKREKKNYGNVLYTSGYYYTSIWSYLVIISVVLHTEVGAVTTTHTKPRNSHQSDNELFLKLSF